MVVHLLVESQRSKMAKQLRNLRQFLAVDKIRFDEDFELIRAVLNMTCNFCILHFELRNILVFFCSF